MANVKKINRVQDTDIKRLNHVGLGLKSIAELLGCHMATITLRLKALGIKPTDTRRSFMEQVFLSLTPDQQEWLSHNLFNADINIQKFITGLIVEAYNSSPTVTPAAPAPMPEMLSPVPETSSVALEESVESEVPLANDPLFLETAAEVEVTDPVTVQVEPEKLQETEEIPELFPGSSPVKLFG